METRFILQETCGTSEINGRRNWKTRQRSRERRRQEIGGENNAMGEKRGREAITIWNMNMPLIAIIIINHDSENKKYGRETPQWFPRFGGRIKDYYRQKYLNLNLFLWGGNSQCKVSSPLLMETRSIFWLGMQKSGSDFWNWKHEFSVKLLCVGVGGWGGGAERKAKEKGEREGKVFCLCAKII